MCPARRHRPSSLYTLLGTIMKKRSYTENQFIDAVKTSTSIRQVLQLIGLKPAGGNYQTVRSTIKELNLDTSHFTGQGWNKGTQQPIKRPIEDYLSNKQTIHSNRLKKRLIREEIFEHRCSKCNLEMWQNQKIPLELDHIDGNHQNNSLVNLRLLCPNCHALTTNYRGKNKGNYSKS